ncbi:hypothetical protein AAFC00_001215 [Neodothiora populina]|uniref:Small ribosomal subunit protein bS18m n=1 Tax=Neodothiora populina TaxID=2781224 RepID=A0ABR3PN53_9PEZI
MSLYNTTLAAARRPTQAYTKSLRLFSSSARCSEGAEGNPWTALMANMKAEQNTQNPRPRNTTQVRARPQFNQPKRADRPNSSLFAVMEDSLQKIGAANKRKESLADIQRANDRQDLERQLTRRWKSGDVYAPHDLSGVEMSKWRQSQPKGRPKRDVFDLLQINPMDHYKNFAMMSEYMTETGRIKHSRDTGLRPVNQRRLAKAVRRAIGLGLMPSVHKHPEILDMQRR